MALPDQNDIDASREFREKDYTGSAEAGSEFLSILHGYGDRGLPVGPDTAPCTIRDGPLS